MQKQTANQELQKDDSLDQQIRLNQIHKSLALDCAGYFLAESSERLRLNSDLPYSPVIVAAHGLIAHREWLDILDRDRLQNVTDQLSGIKGAIDELTDCIRVINKHLNYLDSKLSAENEA